MRDRLVALIVVVVAIVGGALFVSACSGGGSSQSKATKAPPAQRNTGGASVTLKLIAFRPASITVKPGESVTWTQQDPGVHTVTSGTVEQGPADVTVHPDGRFDSKELATGKTFRFTFDTPGTYTYFCKVHPATMRGDVTVR